LHVNEKGALMIPQSAHSVAERNHEGRSTIRLRMVTGFGWSDMQIQDVQDVSKRTRTGSKIERIDPEARMQAQWAVKFHRKPFVALIHAAIVHASCSPAARTRVRMPGDLAATLRYDARRRIDGRACRPRPSLRRPIHARPYGMRARAARSLQDAAT